MIVIDKLCYQSGLRYVNATEKFVYAMLSLLLCVLSRSVWAPLLVFAVNGILTVKKGGIPLFRYIKLLLIPAGFLLVGTAAILVNISKTPLDAFAFPVGTWYITGSRASVLWGVLLCVRALAAVTCLYFLSLNTTMTDILGVLAKLHLPPLVIELMMLVYRFIFVLLETASAIMVSQESRLGNRTFGSGIRAFGGMTASLFILALRKSGALYDAMESRCYDGRIRVLPQENPAKTEEMIMIGAFELVLAALAFLV